MTKSSKTIIILAVIMLLISSYVAVILFRQHTLLDSGATFSRTVSENIITSWNSDYFRQVSSPSLLNSFDANGIALMFSNFKRVGSLVSLGEARGELINSGWLPSDEPLIARYYLDARFSTGPSQVYAELIVENDTWQLLNFYIETPLLAE